jgi:hypothetical protein
LEVSVYGELPRQTGEIFPKLPDMKLSIPVVLIGFKLACFALVQNAQAVSPPPDGGYPGGNTAEGQNALFNLTTGTYNTAVGLFSLRSNTTGKFNTAIGAGTLLVNTADQNTATGAGALLNNTTGGFNTANGAFALLNNTTGDGNTASGTNALQKNTTGGSNTATGEGALFSNTTGNGNTANGLGALLSNTTGNNNTALGEGALLVNTADQSTAIGYAALQSSTTGNGNTATGAQALENNTTGSNNMANGFQALFSNTTGSLNTANGLQALVFNTIGNGNTANGEGTLFSNTTGGGNTAIGSGAGFNQTTGSNNVYIGVEMSGVAGENNACYIASIFSQTSANGIPVLINSNNKLGTATSSKRFKEDIKPMDTASEALFALKPVCFRYKKEIDPVGISQLGLVAEDVEKVNPDLVVRDKEGKPYSVHYDQVNAMLLNEFLKEHRKVEQLTKDFESKLAEQQKQIEALTAGLQKVSAQLEASKPALQVVNNP